MQSGGSNYDWQYLHQGLRLDMATGDYENRARVYDPVLGRFMQVDPLLYKAKDVNLYRYVNNTPTSLVDPSGNSPIVIGAAVVGLWLTICALPAKEGVEKDAAANGWVNDKFIHCVVACRIARRCGNLTSQVIMASWEIFQEGLKKVGLTGPKDGGDWEDIVANLKGGSHAGWESTYFGPVGGWVGSRFRSDCATSCKKSFSPTVKADAPIDKQR